MCVCDRVIVIVGFNELRGQWQEHSIHSCQVFFVSREREIEKETERERERDRKRNRERNRETDIEIEREIERQREN